VSCPHPHVDHGSTVKSAVRFNGLTTANNGIASEAHSFRRSTRARARVLRSNRMSEVPCMPAGRALRRLPCDRSRATEALEIAPAGAIVVNPLVPRLGRHGGWQRLCAPHLPPPRGWWALAASTRSRVLHPHADLLWRPTALVCLSCMWVGMPSAVWQPLPMPQVPRLAL